MGVFQALQNGFISVAKNIKLWLFIVAINVVLMLISYPVMALVFGRAGFQPGVNPTPEQMASVNWPVFVIFIILMALVQTFVNSGTVGCVKDIIKTGTLDLGKFVEYASRFFMRFLGFTVLLLLIMVGVGIIFALLGSLAGVLGNAAAFIGIIFGIILAVIGIAVFALLGIYGSVGPVVIVADDKNLMESLGAAFNFVKAKLGALLGLAALLWLMFFAVYFVNNILVAIGSTAFVLQIVLSFIVSLANIYLSLVYITSFMSFYLGDRPGASASVTQ